MQKFGALCLILLLLLNMAGPAVLLLAVRTAARVEMAALLKNNTPNEKLETVVVSTAQPHGSGFQRIDEREFRYKGRLYDIVRIEHRGDSTVYRCINDEREEQLLAESEDLIADSLNKKRSVPLRSAAKHLITHALAGALPTSYVLFVALSRTMEHRYTFYTTTPDVPTPPPKHFPLA